MVDANVREWKRQLVEQGLGFNDLRRLFACFYEDDRKVVACNPKHLPLVCYLLIALFGRVGLKTNTLKMEAMVFLSGRIKTCLSEGGYCAIMDPEARESINEQRVRCHLCKYLGAEDV